MVAVSLSPAVTALAFAIEGGGVVGIVAKHLGLPVARAQEGQIDLQRGGLAAVEHADVPLLAAPACEADRLADLAARQHDRLIPGRGEMTQQVLGGVADEVLVFPGEVQQRRGHVDRLGQQVRPGVADHLAGIEGGWRVIGRTGQEAGEEDRLVVVGGLDAAVARHVVFVAAHGFASELMGPCAAAAGGLDRAVKVAQQVQFGGVLERALVPASDLGSAGGDEIDLDARGAEGGDLFKIGPSRGVGTHFRGVHPHQAAHALGFAVVNHVLETLPLVLVRGHANCASLRRSGNTRSPVSSPRRPTPSGRSAWGRRWPTTARGSGRA